jgi:hypothetical protein
MATIKQFYLPLGNHECMQWMMDLKIEPTDGPLVKLIASVEPVHRAPPGPGRHLWATTLTIHMDVAAAIALSEQIRALARTHGLAAAARRRTPSLKAFHRGFGISVCMAACSRVSFRTRASSLRSELSLNRLGWRSGPIL